MKPLLILNLLLASLSLILSPFSSAARQVSDRYQLESRYAYPPWCTGPHQYSRSE